jgi:hypothetical protein
VTVGRKVKRAARHDLVRKPKTCAGRRSARMTVRVAGTDRSPRRRAGVHAAMIRAALLASLLASLVVASPAGAARTLVSYEQSGGIAGTRISLSVTIGGNARVTSSRVRGIKRFKLARDDLHALKRDLRDARFSTLRALYDTKMPVADGISQTVRYDGRRVTVSTGARPPLRLRTLLTRLARLAARGL